MNFFAWRFRNRFWVDGKKRIILFGGVKDLDDVSARIQLLKEIAIPVVRFPFFIHKTLR